jgi:hypothetical protein
MSSKYGSELHLLRYLGRHRDDFDKRVIAETGGDSVKWLDFGYDNRSKQSYDAELIRHPNCSVPGPISGRKVLVSRLGTQSGS